MRLKKALLLNLEGLLVVAFFLSFENLVNAQRANTYGPGLHTYDQYKEHTDNMQYWRNRAAENNRSPSTNTNSNYNFAEGRRKALDEEKRQTAERQSSRAQYEKETREMDKARRTVVADGVSIVLDESPRYFATNIRTVRRGNSLGLLKGEVTNGSLVQPFIYNSFSPFINNLFSIARSGNKYSVIGRDGNTLLPPVYDSISVFSGNLFLVKKSGLYGIVNVENKAVAPVKYYEIEKLKNGMAIITTASYRSGIIDSTGKFLLPADYRLIQRLPNHNVILAKDDKFEMVKTKTWESVASSQYSMLVDYSFNKAVLAEKDGKYGFLDYSGKEIIPVKYNIDWRIPGYDYAGKIKHAGKAGVIDLGYDGKILESVPPVYDSIVGYYPSEGKAVVINGGIKKEIPLNLMGFKAIRGFIKEKAAATKGGGWGFIDYSGKMIIPLNFEEVGDFSSRTEIRDGKIVDAGVARAKMNGKWGHINLKGEWITEPVYDEVLDFDGSYAKVKNNNKFGLINIRKEVITACIYDEIRMDKDLIYAIMVKDKSGKWGIMDFYGKLVVPCKYDDAKVVSVKYITEVKRI
ncbi:MAG TPA: WG repeat-containing protein, partial [Chitinophagaceae bacterium]